MFKAPLLFTVLIVLSVSAQAAALPGNTEQGRKLHDANCLSCHNDSVYTRKDRHVTSLEGLSAQIGACGHMSGVKLDKSQVNDLVKYLNRKFYKFK